MTAMQQPAEELEGSLPPALRFHVVGHLQAPLWREGWAWVEYMQLLRNPVWRGVGVPRGDGRPVLLIPGFLSGDYSLNQLAYFLRRVGYQPHLSGVNFNFLHSDAVLEGVTRRLLRASGPHRRRVTIIGQSRGGCLAKVMADRNPSLVDRVITLGSPLMDPYDVHPATMTAVRVCQAYNALRFGLGVRNIDKRFLDQMLAPAHTPLFSIYSRTDGIINWRSCIRSDAENFEVRSSHVGMGLNAEVYRLVGDLLARRVRRRTLN
ncbi:MAG: esterase/lipase family protein [Candidatus Dormibacteria bacterium]